MRVLGYGRTSQDDQDSSLTDQKAICKEFCETTDDHEYGETHEFCGWHQDRDVSGSIYPAERPGFSDLIDHLNEDESIDGIVVKNFKRLGRDPIDQITIKRFLERLHVGREIEIMCVDPWEGDRRSLMDPRVQMMKDSDDPLAEWNKALVFIVNGLSDARTILDASVGSEKAAEQAQKENNAWGTNPQGLVSHKIAFADSDDTTQYVPVEVAESEAIQEWEHRTGKDWDKEHVPLREVIEVITRFINSDTDPHESYVQPTANSVATDMGWDGGTQVVQNVWDKRDDYMEIATEYEDECGFQLPR